MREIGNGEIDHTWLRSKAKILHYCVQLFPEELKIKGSIYKEGANVVFDVTFIPYNNCIAIDPT